MPNKSIPKIFIAGHKGMVGSSLVRLLSKKDLEIITKDKSELDLLNQKQVEYFFKNHKIDQVYLAAARVGGIHANDTYPANFIYENLTIQSNIIHNAFLSGVKKLLFLGSSCIYPRNVSQPIKEESLMTGKLEPTNEPYAIAKIAGIKMCESYNRQYGKSHGVDYRSVMPTNLYGPGDNYHPENSHVIPALINRFHFGKKNEDPKVKVWGSGKPKREFLFVDDLARALIHVMNIEENIFNEKTSPITRHINIGWGVDYTIRELANIIKKVVGYRGVIEFDSTKPDGTPRKLLDCQLINSLNWYPKTDLEEGISITYNAYKKTRCNI